MVKKFKKLIAVLVALSVIMLAFILNISGFFNKIETKFIDLRLALNKDKNINILDIIAENMDGGTEAIERRLKAYGKSH